MARPKGRGITIPIGGDYSELQKKLGEVKTISKGAGAALAEAMRGGITFGQASKNIDLLAASMAKIKSNAQAMGADFKKAEQQLGAVAKAAGLSEKQFASLGKQMAQKTNLDNLESSLRRIQNLTGASALQMAKLRAEAGDLTGAIRGLGRAASDGLGSLINWKNALMAGAAGMAFREYSRVTSIMTDLDARIRLATSSADEAAAAFARIHDVANRTYASLESTAEIFLANSTAFNDLGFSTKQQLDLMESLTNALVVSGAKGQRAETVINAMAKAMMEGELRGRNWTTVLQQGGRVVQALADGIGVSIQELKRMAETGELTTGRVVEALTGQIENLRGEADAMPATMSDAFVKLGNNYKVLVKAFDEIDTKSSQVVKGIDWISENLIYLADKGDAVFTTLTSSVGVWINSLMAAGFAAAAFFKTLAALVESPTKWKDALRHFDAELEGIGQTWKEIIHDLAQDFEDSGSRFEKGAAKAKAGAEMAADAAANSVGPAHNAADAFRDLAAAMSLIGGAGAQVGTTIEASIKFMLDATRQAKSAQADVDRITKSNERYAMAHIALEIDALSKRNDLTREQQDHLLGLEDTYKKLKTYQADIARDQVLTQAGSKAVDDARAKAESLKQTRIEINEHLKSGLLTQQQYNDALIGLRNEEKRIQQEIDRFGKGSGGGGRGGASRAAREAEKALKDQYKAGQLVLELEKELAQLTGQTTQAKILEIDKQAEKWRFLAEKIKDAEERAKAFGLIMEVVAEKMKAVSDDAMTGLTKAVDSWLESNTAADKAAEMFNTTTNAATSFFTDIVTGNKSVADSFNNLATTIVNALAKIAVEMLVIRPIIQGFQNMLGGFGGFSIPSGGVTTTGVSGGGVHIPAPTFTPSAKGNIFGATATLAAYENKIVNSPTMFAFAKGGVGLMGEAGEEAIMPLERDSRGRLGVSVADGYIPGAPQVSLKQNIEIINQTGTPVRAETTTQRAANGDLQTRMILKGIDEGLANRQMAGGTKLGRSFGETDVRSLYFRSPSR